MNETNKIDTAALRAKWSEWFEAALDPQSLRSDFMDCLDALDEARLDLAIEQSEKSEWQESCNHWHEIAAGEGKRHQAEHARAEKAEAESAEASEAWTWMRNHAEGLEAKLARVEALVDEYNDEYACSWSYFAEFIEKACDIFTETS